MLMVLTLGPHGVSGSYKQAWCVQLPVVLVQSKRTPPTSYRPSVRLEKTSPPCLNNGNQVLTNSSMSRLTRSMWVKNKPCGAPG
jgi:hypothetical protein